MSIMWLPLHWENSCPSNMSCKHLSILIFTIPRLDGWKNIVHEHFMHKIMVVMELSIIAKVVMLERVGCKVVHTTSCVVTFNILLATCSATFHLFAKVCIETVGNLFQSLCCCWLLVMVDLINSEKLLKIQNDWYNHLNWSLIWRQTFFDCLGLLPLEICLFTCFNFDPSFCWWGVTNVLLLSCCDNDSILSYLPPSTMNLCPWVFPSCSSLANCCDYVLEWSQQQCVAHNHDS
jgi:hypothetical protein